MKTNLYLAIVVAICTLTSGCFFDESDADLRDLYPYKANTSYANVLVDCAQADSTSSSCRLSTLPTIGMVTREPTLTDVMDRVVVSHDWMGENFESLMEALPEDILYLMQGVTAVVIGKDIRPSFYRNLTGAIYLDPGSLWLTLDQLEVISTEPDYREAFADPMAFRSFWRWSKDSGGAWPYQGVDANGVRPLTDIVYPMASLLFHELAHANDLMPLSAYDNIDMDDTIYAASSALYAQYPSTMLMNNDPLQSTAMDHFANILYRGFVPSDEDKQTSAATIGTYFEPDIASDDYNYTSQFEDLAMLFEEAMMKISFGIDRDMAFVTPTGPDESRQCDDYIIGWGARNRVGDVNVLPRAQFALESLLPQRDFSEALATIPLPSTLPEGSGWCESIDLGRLFYKTGGYETNGFDRLPVLPQHSKRLYPVFSGW